MGARNRGRQNKASVRVCKVCSVSKEAEPVPLRPWTRTVSGSAQLRLSSTVSGVPPHLEALSWPDKPHPCGCRDKRWARQEGEGQILDSWAPGVRGGLGGWGGIAGEGREKLPREVQDPGSCCEGLTAQVSPDRSDASLPLTSV